MRTLIVRFFAAEDGAPIDGSASLHGGTLADGRRRETEAAASGARGPVRGGGCDGRQ